MSADPPNDDTGSADPDWRAAPAASATSPSSTTTAAAARAAPIAAATRLRRTWTEDTAAGRRPIPGSARRPTHPDARRAGCTGRTDAASDLVRIALGPRTRRRRDPGGACCRTPAAPLGTAPLGAAPLGTVPVAVAALTGGPLSRTSPDR